MGKLRMGMRVSCYLWGSRQRRGTRRPGRQVGEDVRLSELSVPGNGKRREKKPKQTNKNKLAGPQRTGRWILGLAGAQRRLGRRPRPKAVDMQVLNTA